MFFVKQVYFVIFRLNMGNCLSHFLSENGVNINIEFIDMVLL